MINVQKQFSNDIIIIGQQPWDTEIGSNCKNIALELAKTNRVLYINSPLDRITLFRNKQDPKIKKRLNVIKKRENGLIEILPNLWNYYPDTIVESINWISIAKVFDFFNKINNKRFAKSIKKAITKLNFRDFVLFNDNEMFKGYYLQELLKPRIAVYYSRDYMLGVEYWKKHGELLEPLLISKSNLCFANSAYLAEYCARYNDHSYYVGQGCDIEAFQNISPIVPSDIAGLNRKIIGYVGSLNSMRLDISLIEHIAITLIDYLIVLVGPEDLDFKSSGLHKLSNVIFIGQRPVDELPLYIKSFDICINPQLLNPITIGNYPRKIDEYLAVGKPVIATRTKTMEVFDNYVYLADTQEDYIVLIKKALQEDSLILQTERKNFAITHTWKNSVQLMKNEIVNYLQA